MTERRLGVILPPFWDTFRCFSNFFASLGADPEDFGADPEDFGADLETSVQGASKSASFSEPFLRLWRPRPPKSVKKKYPGKTLEKERQNLNKNVVFWKVGHAIRTRLRSPNTLFPFLVFLEKKHIFSGKSS